jgi:hypothetical protein
MLLIKKQYKDKGKGEMDYKAMKAPINTLALCIITALCVIFLNSCSPNGGDSWRYDPGIPKQVTGLKAESGNQVVTLSWDGNPIATSYNIYYSSTPAEDADIKSSGTTINVTTTSKAIFGLDNNVTYYFMVTALNRDGESIGSLFVSATPLPFVIPTSENNEPTDVPPTPEPSPDPGTGSTPVTPSPNPFITSGITGSWYFHTLVSGTDAKWERGRITVDTTGNAVISDFQDSAHYNPDYPWATIDPPHSFSFSINAAGEVGQQGIGAWPGFHGIIGSRKNMIVATFSPNVTSRGITIFQKKRDTDDYSELDVSGTGSGQNPYYPELQGNGPTRYAYHQLSSGSSTEWEYSNCKIGQHGGIWLEQYKDITYWDYGTPTYKVAAKYDYLGKVTSIGVDPDGLVKEYSNYAAVKDGIHNVVFTGRMSADKTLIIGVSTRDDGSGGNKTYFLKIMQLCFYPVDQALPVYTLNDLAGTYKFHKLSSAADAGNNVAATWAYGTMNITASGVLTFPEYRDSKSASTSSDMFTLFYYPDNGTKAYTDFANFTTLAQSGASHYYDADGNPYHTYYDYWSYGRTDQPLAIPISSEYYNEHGSLSYNRDMFVMTRTDDSGYAMIIGLK